MTLVEKVNGRYVEAARNLTEIYESPPSTYREKYDYNKAVKAGRRPVKQTKQTLQIAHELETELKYVNIGMDYVIQFIQEANINAGGAYSELLEQIGSVDEEVIQATYEKRS